MPEPARTDAPSVTPDRWERAERERAALLRLARRVGLTAADADDCVQEAILSVVARADVDDARLGALLSVAVKRRAIDMYRRTETARRTSRKLSVVGHAETEAADVALCDRAEAEWSATLVRQLPPFQREVLIARADGRSWKEIAHDLRTTVTAVESAVARARTAMRLAIASTLGIAIALVRRWRAPAPAPALAAATATLLLAVAVTSLLHPREAPGARPTNQQHAEPAAQASTTEPDVPSVAAAHAATPGPTAATAHHRATSAPPSETTPRRNSLWEPRGPLPAPPESPMTVSSPLYKKVVQQTDDCTNDEPPTSVDLANATSPPDVDAPCVGVSV